MRRGGGTLRERILTERLAIRRYRPGDEYDLVRAADDPRVAIHLTDRFPSPYTLADAREWIADADEAPALTMMAITRGGRVIGGIGLTPGEDVYRFSAEIGYWLGVDHWGEGLATEAVAAFCAHVFAETGYVRLTARVFEGNPASERVLEKCGFVLESVARRAASKSGRLLDVSNYARLRP